MRGYLDTKTAAERLGVSRRRILQLIEQGHVKAERVQGPAFGSFLILEKSFEAFVKDEWPHVKPRGVQRGEKRNLSSASAEGAMEAGRIEQEDGNAQTQTN